MSIGRLDSVYIITLCKRACVHEIPIKYNLIIFMTYLDHNHLFVEKKQQILLQIILQQNQKISFTKQLYLNSNGLLYIIVNY